MNVTVQYLFKVKHKTDIDH